MPFYPMNFEGTGTSETPTPNIDWPLAKKEMELFNDNLFAEENFLLMRIEQLETIIARARVIQDESEKDSYIACVFGKGESRHNMLPKNKLTAILFPVIYDPSPGTDPDTHYRFYKDTAGKSDRDNPDYIQQTWIDPTPNNVPHRNHAVVAHFDSQESTPLIT